jgi:hypothetical protein
VSRTAPRSSTLRRPIGRGNIVVGGVAFAGVWSGLLALITMVLHPMMRAQDGPTFARQLAMLVPSSRHTPVKYVCGIGLVVAPAGALAAMNAAGDRSTAFLLTAIGLAADMVGLIVAYLFAEPNYDRMLAWNPDCMPEVWQVVRSRYFALNWTHAVLTWSAFGLFIAALVRRA